MAALYQAHNEQKPLENRHVLEELARTRSLSVVMAEKLTALRASAQERTVTQINQLVMDMTAL